MRIVSLLAPIRSGVYQFHCNLVSGLAHRDCSITWLCSGASQNKTIYSDNAKQTEGDIVAGGTDELTLRTKALVNRISEISPNAINCHARGDIVDLNAIRYVPDSIPKILVLHGSTLAVYRAARVVRDYICATVAISPRIMSDLVTTYGFCKDRMILIPHGIDLAAFSGHLLREKSDKQIRIIFHGRIDKEQKGILWLPGIFMELAHYSRDWSCTISGDGPDIGELKLSIERTGLSNHIQFVGWTAPERVPEMMSRHDVFLFPSTYEGSPIALIEAMAAGCLPVASRLPGITDWIIQDGVNGMLFSIGNVQDAARHLFELISDRHRLIELRKRARCRVSNFDISRMADQYCHLFSEIQMGSEQIQPSEDVNECLIASGFEPAWWYRIPRPIKNYLRIMREKLHQSIAGY